MTNQLALDLHGGMRPGICLALPLFSWGVVSCGGPPEPGLHRVVPFQMTTVQLPDESAPMVRNEVRRRLHGAVSPSEQRDRLGHYFTINWSVADPAAGPVDLVLRYQQTRTASKELVRRLSVMPEDAGEHRSEIKIMGGDYRENGPLLAWRLELQQAGKVIDFEESFLWK